MFNFTKRKFQSFPEQKQHKKCAELIRFLYEQKDGDTQKQLLEIYTIWQAWMGIILSPIHNAKTLIDRFHHHLKLGQVALKEWNLLSCISTGDRETAREEPGTVSIYLDGIRSAFNVGSIVRTVEALSLGTLYFSKDTPFIDHSQVQKTSMGAYQWVHCMQNVPLCELPKPIVALETSSSATSLYDFIFPECFSLVLGNEEYGCSELTLKQIDFLVEIPMCGRKNSLNVANAFALAAGEIRRQKNLKANHAKIKPSHETIKSNQKICLL